MIFTGAELDAIRKEQFDDRTVLMNAGRLLRHVIAHHLDGQELKSRKVLREMHRTMEKEAGASER